METNKITYRLIEQYIQGKLDEKSMHELEREALKDPFLADALEGYTHAENAAGPQLSLLQKQLEERIALQEEKRNAFHFSWQRISVAAAACLLFISASILFWMKGSRNRIKNQATEKQVDVTLTHPDSVKNFRYGSQSSANANQNELPATPKGGWAKFEKYLQENKKLEQSSSEKSKVTLSFKVGSLGQPVNIKVVEGLTEEFNNEAVRLLKEGPKWEYLGKQEVRIKIDFRKNLHGQKHTNGG